MTRFRSSLSLLALVAAVPAFAQEAPVREVVLYEAGLAELTRETGEQGVVRLSVPLRDVNDVLKSLLVRGVGATGARMELAGETPVADAFASLPFPPEAATDLTVLLRSVPGVRVSVAEPGFPEGRAGVVMEVREVCDIDGACETWLTVLGDDGAIRRHVFDSDLSVTILDAEVSAALARGLGVLREAASGAVREVVVTITGEVEDGALSYVVAAPAWKTSYRALTGAEGAVDLQAWAVIENATGEDWADVDLTLSSGSPVTLMADLHGRDWRYREDVTGDDGGFAPVVVAPEPMMVVEQEASRVAMEAGAMADAYAAPAPAPIAAGTAAEEGVLDSRFAFPEPVDLPAGQMLSLPFLTDELDATHLSLWQGQLFTRTGNPDMVLEVTNDLAVRLPAGIMTVSDEAGGYVGDADFPLVAPGETEAVPYGVDRKLRVEETVSETVRQVSVIASEGVLRIRQEQVRDVGYLVTSPSGEARELVIDHPLGQGWGSAVIDGPSGEVRQDDDGRRWLRLVVPVEGDGAVVRVRDRYPFENVVEIGTMDEATILSWAGQAADEVTEDYLQEAAALMRELSGAEGELFEVEGEISRLTNEQARVQRLLSSVPQPSEAYDRFLADLLRLEDEIRERSAEADALREAAAQARAALEAHLSAG